MRPILTILALIGALLAPVAEAQVQATVNIRVLYTHTARASIGAGNLAAHAGALVGELKAALDASGGDTKINPTVSYDGTTACCGGNNDFRDLSTTVPDNAMTWAGNDIRVQEGRDKAFGGSGADVLVIVAEPVFGPDGATLMQGCYPSSQGTARRAIIGVNKNAPISAGWELLKQFAKLNCGADGNAQPYWFMEPPGAMGAGLPCTNFYTAGSTVPASQTVNLWHAALSLPTSIGYAMASANAAGANAASTCGFHNGLGITYVCSSVSCTGSPNAVCAYTLRRTYSAPHTPSVVTTTEAGTAVFTSHTCSNNARLFRYSNPNQMYRGQPLGDATHNSVGGQNARLPVTNTLRNIKTAPPLKAGAIIDFSL